VTISTLPDSAVVQGKKLHGVSETTLVKEIAFVVIESLLAWLSSLEEDERSVFLEAMTDEESWLCYSLLRDYYVARPEAKRTKSGADALEPSARISAYRSGRSPDWLKVKKSGLLGGEAEAEEDWGH